MEGGQAGQGRQQKSLKSVWGESTIRINVQEWRLLYEGMKSGGGWKGERVCGYLIKDYNTAVTSANDKF